MILRRRNPLQILAIGQVCMVFGILIIWLLRPFETAQPMTFMTGFLTAMSGCLLGLSLVLNLAGMIRLRKEQSLRENDKI